MTLEALLRGIDAVQPPTLADVQVTGLSFDSRNVLPGNAFCALVGGQLDGHEHAAQAVEKGASLLIVSRPLPLDCAQVVVADTRVAFAQLCANWFGHPAERMTLFGVTGTNGKTSTAFMLHTLLQAAGQKAGLMGTVCVKSGERLLGENLTTPEPYTLQGFLRAMADDGCASVAMEVSSHALSQHRVEGLRFKVGIFTNLTQDHLDYHGTMAQYAAEKRKLFAACEFGLLNADDAHSDAMREGNGDCAFFTFGIENQADFRATDVECTARGVSYTLTTPQGQQGRVTLAVPGLFSVYNSLGAAAACLLSGMAFEQVIEGLAQVKTVPGRIEVVDTGNSDFTVVLDYAHTPDGLINILSAVRGITQGRVIALFGCGGDRDPAKRPLMGRAAGEGADYCIVTSDNPRTEDPAAIIAAILPGIEATGCPYEVVVNRQEAITRAVRCALPGDVVVLAGKGHEPYQEINGVRSPFDEKAMVRDALEGK